MRIEILFSDIITPYPLYYCFITLAGLRRTVITTHVDVNVIYQSKSHHLIMMTRSPNYCSAVISALNKRGGAYLHCHFSNMVFAVGTIF